MILLWSESPSGKCAKLHTVTASNNRDHPTRSRCLFVPIYIWVCFFSHIPFMVNRTFNATSTERLQKHPFLFATNRTDRTFFLWRLHLAWPSHHHHPMGWSQHHFVAIGKPKWQRFTLRQQATTEIYHLTRSLIACLCHIRVYVYYSSCTSPSWWIAHYSTQRQPRGCNNTLGLLHGLCHMT